MFIFVSFVSFETTSIGNRRSERINILKCAHQTKRFNGYLEWILSFLSALTSHKKKNESVAVRNVNLESTMLYPLQSEKLRQRKWRERMSRPQEFHLIIETGLSEPTNVNGAMFSFVLVSIFSWSRPLNLLVYDIEWQWFEICLRFRCLFRPIAFSVGWNWPRSVLDECVYISVLCLCSALYT